MNNSQGHVKANEKNSKKLLYKMYKKHFILANELWSDEQHSANIVKQIDVDNNAHILRCTNKYCPHA